VYHNCDHFLGTERLAYCKVVGRRVVVNLLFQESEMTCGLVVRIYQCFMLSMVRRGFGVKEVYADGTMEFRRIAAGEVEFN